jgi:hypothetical protein
VTGFVFDYEREEVEEIIGPISDAPVIEEPIKPLIDSSCKCSTVETGKTEAQGNYVRKEFKCKNHNDNVWGKWEYSGINDRSPWIGTSGCLGNFISIIGAILFLAFIIAILPAFGHIVLFFIAILVIGFLEPYFKWIFRGIGIILLIAFFSSLLSNFNNRSTRYNPNPPSVVNNESEIKETREPIVDNNSDSSNSDSSKNQINNPKDYLIKKYREWQDYEGNIYKGYYTLRKSDIVKAHDYKSSLQIVPSTRNTYDKVVFSLKENDKNKLAGIYKLFDSIQTKKSLSNIKFAEMVVSFVQDIPYVLVLDSDCNPNLYNDSFTKNYLLKNQGDCDGPQRFGINTPLEFLYSLKGDCDTRTLLLYTLLSNYNYDVALMSSEFYGHSVLGINLPLNGVKYKYQNQQYVLWETTTPNTRPGLIPNTISNTNNWRISLKSK